MLGAGGLRLEPESIENGKRENFDRFVDGVRLELQGLGTKIESLDRSDGQGLLRLLPRTVYSCK